MPHVPDLVLRFAEACGGGGKAAALEALLHAEVVALCDGGGKALAAALQPVHGAEIVARLIIAQLCNRPGTVLTVESVNGRPGLALRQAGTVLAVVAVRAAAGRITHLWIVLNPDKLHGWHNA